MELSKCCCGTATISTGAILGGVGLLVLGAITQYHVAYLVAGSTLLGLGCIANIVNCLYQRGKSIRQQGLMPLVSY
jgi:hypothetical protein